jgi:hypothetical protein
MAELAGAAQENVPAGTDESGQIKPAHHLLAKR